MVPESDDDDEHQFLQLGPKITKTDEEYIKEWDETPLFMNALPEDHDTNPMLSAIQSLIFDGTPIEVATNFKNQGNESYNLGKKHMPDALSYYTKALEAKCDDMNLNSIIYSNRAAVHIDMKNYRKALHDCAAAIKANSTNLKAYYRSSVALFAVDKVVEALDCIERGLLMDPENVSFINHRQKYVASLALAKETEQKKRVFMKEKLDEEKILCSEIEKRGIKHTTLKPVVKYAFNNFKEVFNPEKHSLFPPVYHPQAGHHRVTFDNDSSTLSWPVMLFYPEYQESDFIAQFHEETLFIEITAMLFEQTAHWDSDQKYLPSDVGVYFEGSGLNGKVELFKVGNGLTLGDVLKHDKYLVTDGVPSFIILSEKGVFAKEFRNEYVLI